MTTATLRPLFLALGCVAGTLAGCSSSSTPSTCVVGESQACACSDGRKGAQVCGASGSFEACSCADPMDAGEQPERDAGAADAGQEQHDAGTGAADASLDAGSDAGSDAGTVDPEADGGMEDGGAGRPQDYQTTAGTYVSALTVPPVDSVSGEYTCCRDLDGDGTVDNAWAQLFAAMASLGGPNLQDSLTEMIEAGQLAVVLDHRGLGTPGASFELAWLRAAFAPGIGYPEAAAGAGRFVLSMESFHPGTDRPRHLLEARLSPDLVAEGESVGLTMPFGAAPLVFEIQDVRLEAQAGPDWSYSGGLSGVIPVEQLFVAMNAMLESPRCECLGLTEPVFFHDGTRWSGRCVSGADELCPEDDQEACRILGGSFCSLLPAALGAYADLDLDADGAKDAFSLGLQWQGVATAEVLGCIPTASDSCEACEAASDCARFQGEDLCAAPFRCVDRNCEIDPAARVVCGESDDPCQPLQCVPATGLCEPVALADGTACDAGFCVLDATCQQGECIGSSGACADGNPCTQDSCNEVTGCAYLFAPDGTPCDDGDPATVDACYGGECMPVE